MAQPIHFGSYCAGIEALSVASAPFNWRPSFLCEIAPHPRQVLRVRHRAQEARRHYQPLHGPLLWGDFTALRVRHLLRAGAEIPDVIGGGTPCQAFSRAGKRGSLSDARGNLTLEFVRQVHAIDNLRAARGLPGLVVLWENVPGVLNTPDNAFGCFLGGLVGADGPVRGLPNGKPPGDGERGEPECWGKWPDAGMVEGPRGRAAWRVLDAQYFGLAQRRRRVWLVLGLRDRIDPAAVLFERQGLSRDPPPRRGAGEGVAGTLSARSEGVDSDCTDTLVPCLAFALRGREDGAVPEISGDVTGTLRAGGGGSSNDYVAFGITRDALDRSGEGSGGTPRERSGLGVLADQAQTLKAKGPGAVATASAVRRLTPGECETLQGFRRGYTAVPWRGGTMPDGPRYKMLGNSWAVNNARWIVGRIDAQMRGLPMPAPGAYLEVAA